MQKQVNKGFLLWEVLVALALLTYFLGSTGKLFRSSWSLVREGNRRIKALERVIEMMERGDNGQILVIRGERGLPDCRYRLVEVDGVWVCGKI